MTQRHPSELKASVRADDGLIRQTLERLDSAPRDPKAMQRAHRRFQYRQPCVEIALQNPQSAYATRFVVPARNLSNRGIAVLHGAFTHKGTRCVVRLIDRDQRPVMAPGQVVRCRYVDNWMHELSIRFDEPIDAMTFAGENDRLRLLIVDAESPAARAVADGVTARGIDAETTTEAAEALERAKAQFFDAIIVEPASPGIELPDFLTQVRRTGFTRPIVALTRIVDEQASKKALSSGCDAWLIKPVTEAMLDELVRMIKAGDASRRAA